MATLAVGTFAKPAKPGLMDVTTADGATLKVRLVGDEFYHQYFTEDGYPLIEKDGNFYYCDFDASGNITDSGIKAQAVNLRANKEKNYLSGIDKSTLDSRIRLRADRSPRRASLVSRNADSPKKAPAQSESNPSGPPFEKGYGLFSDTHFPAYGDQKAIVILVEYTDVKFNTSYDAGDYFTRMLNEDDFSDYGATGSAAQYFRVNSKGAFVPEFDVYGPIQLAHNQAYYGGNDWWGNDKDPGAMVKEACDALDDIVDFKDFDRDNDGIVDNIFIFYAGRGEASGGSANTVWPHSWDMTSAGYPNLYYDGVKIHTYGCSNEWESGRPDGVGTFIHEFSHVMGLPDLYATSYTSAFTPGEWSALDYGPYNNNGMTPPNYGAFERYALGWVKPYEVNRAVSATLPPIDDNVCGIIRTSKPTEFFLLENRQQTGWDTYIPHHGMLIWHVDYNESVWNSNKVNNTASHQYVDIEEADGTQSSYSISGDPFPGTSNKTSFTSSTNPAMKTWNGTAINYPITNIAESAGLITFDVLGGSTSELAMLEPKDPTDITFESFNLNWSEPIDDNDVLLNVYTLNNGEPQFIQGFERKNIGNVSSYNVTGVDPQTTYYYSVAQTNGWESSAFSEPQSVFTGRMTIDYYSVIASEASEITDKSFVANWESLDDAESYYLSVYTKILGKPFYEENGFDDGTGNLGDWTVSSNVSTYGMASYAGTSVPSLRIPSGASVTTPVYDDYIYELSFWHRGNSTSDGDRMDIYATTTEGTKLIETVPVSTVAGGVTTELKESIPEETTRIQIQFIRAGNKGYLALDDVKVGHGMDFMPVYLPDYEDLEVGDNLSYEVTGLNSSTDYYYTVRATDGIRDSKDSSEIHVSTLSATTSVEDNLSERSAIVVDGKTVYHSGDDMIIVSDLTGIIVAKGHGIVTVPNAGFYIVSVPSLGLTQKIIIK